MAASHQTSPHGLRQHSHNMRQVIHGVLPGNATNFFNNKTNKK